MWLLMPFLLRNAYVSFRKWLIIMDGRDCARQTVFQIFTSGHHNAEFITTGIDFYLDILEHKKESV